MIWKPSHFFTSLTNKLQESRLFPSIRQFTVCNQEVKGEHFLQPKQRKNNWKKVLACSSYCEEPPCFYCFVCGEKRPFLIVQVSTVKVMLCFAGLVWCPGLAEAPMPSDARVPEPGNWSGWGWAAPGGRARRKGFYVNRDCSLDWE